MKDGSEHYHDESMHMYRPEQELQECQYRCHAFRAPPAHFAGTTLFQGGMPLWLPAEKGLGKEAPAISKC